MKNILITGGNGQLANTFKHLESNYSSYNFNIKSKEELDITNFLSLSAEIINNKYDFIFNCAAYTNVNMAEENENETKLVNSDAVKHLVKLIEGTKCKLIHFSSDYVFDGKKKTNYLETDNQSPINKYGNSKYLAEKYILNSTSQSVIIRTSWLFSEFNSNFVKKIIELTNQRNQIYVTDKEIGSPTYSIDLANFCMTLCDENKSWNGDIFNFSNTGFTSRYDFAKKIIEFLNIDCKITKSKNLNNANIIRPLNSRLSLMKIKTRFNIIPRNWEEALDECIKKII